MIAIDVSRDELARAVARARRRRRALIAGLAVLLAGPIGFLVWAPAWLSFGAAVAAAVAWCIWLERHPEPGSDGRAR